MQMQKRERTANMHNNIVSCVFQNPSRIKTIETPTRQISITNALWALDGHPGAEAWQQHPQHCYLMQQKQRARRFPNESINSPPHEDCTIAYHFIEYITIKKIVTTTMETSAGGKCNLISPIRCCCFFISGVLDI